MFFFKKYRNLEAKRKLQKNLQAITDPLEPLEVFTYPASTGRPKILDIPQIIQIINWKSENQSNCEIARRLHVSESTIRRCLKSISGEGLAERTIP